jgi:integrase
VLDGWVAALRERRVARSTINGYWRGVRAILRRVQARRHVVNPLDYRPVPRVGHINPRCLPRHAAEQLLRFVGNFQWSSDFVRSRNVGIVATMLLAGLRRGEILRVTVSDIDPVARTIRIVQGKGRHGGKDRTAYMTDQLREILTAYLLVRRRGEYATPALFVQARADRAIEEGAIRRLFRTIRDVGGIPCTPHALRHTYATLLRQAGVPDRVAMELLGHTSLQMLQRYSHVFDGEQVQEAAKLALNLGAQP